MALEPSGALSVSSLCASLRERYIYTVVSSELYSPEYYRQKGLSSAQVSRLYKTQAIVANTYYEYCDSVYSNHRGQGYKVCNTDCCQVCDSAKMNQVAALAGAAGNTVDIYLMTVQNGADCLLFSWTSTRQGHSSQEMKAYQMQMEKDRMKAVPLECF